jgi:hypothetical protein
MPRRPDDRDGTCTIDGRIARYVVHEDLSIDFRFGGEETVHHCFVTSRIVVDENTIRVQCTDEDVSAEHVEAAREILARSSGLWPRDPVVFARAMRMSDNEVAAEWNGLEQYSEEGSEP